eukprot:GHVP01010868.1.p1 GENE.GHVP01010868.1~~GHVP01010868.1.p1  ORF type:complete len:139 (-),score=10.99 GHVP01010868.1:30-446(-)
MWLRSEETSMFINEAFIIYFNRIFFMNSIGRAHVFSSIDLRRAQPFIKLTSSIFPRIISPFSFSNLASSLSQPISYFLKTLSHKSGDLFLRSYLSNINHLPLLISIYWHFQVPWQLCRKPVKLTFLILVEVLYVAPFL